MLVNMTDMISRAADTTRAIPGFNVFGYEDAEMVIEVAEKLGAPVILMSNKGAVEHMDVKYYSALFRAMAEDAKVPVCIHLDHATEIDVIKEALDAGYTSVMYDGSQLSLEDNKENTRYVVELAHKYNASVEGEIGSVGYSDPSLNVDTVYTSPEEAKLFADETKVDALAVAVGTLHRMQTQGAEIQYDLLRSIEDMTDVPLVIHGSSGLKDDDIEKLSKHRVGKFNIGTAIRMVFGNTLREEINNNPDEFDRVVLFKKPMQEIKKVIEKKYRLLGFN